MMSATLWRTRLLTVQMVIAMTTQQQLDNNRKMLGDKASSG
eukprot:COSAG06_NODE_4090_length_4585_cov_2.219795_3_plen_41_part_00